MFFFTKGLFSSLDDIDTTDYNCDNSVKSTQKKTPPKRQISCSEEGKIFNRL